MRRCTRRPRSTHEAVPWMCHLLALHGGHIDEISYETDRARFIGRGRAVTHPVVMDQGSGGQSKLSNSAGSVLDPIVAIRCRVTLDAGQSATIDLVTGVADSREGCLQLIDKYRDRHLADRVFDLAWTHSQVLLGQLNASLSDARLYEQMHRCALNPAPWSPMNAINPVYGVRPFRAIYRSCYCKSMIRRISNWFAKSCRHMLIGASKGFPWIW